MARVLINVDVPNLQDAVRFYRAGWGFEFRRTLFEGGVAELLASGTKLYLIEHREGAPSYPGADSARTYHRHWTPVHIDVVVDDIDDAVAKAVSAGATLSGERQRFVWGQLAPLSDPFGHGVCLLQFTRAGYDAVAD